MTAVFILGAFLQGCPDDVISDQGCTENDKRTRTAYEAEEVPSGQECKSEVQRQVCIFDEDYEANYWGPDPDAESDEVTVDGWSGSFLYESCTVLEEPPECEGDEEETRTRYETPAANSADDEACRSEEQSRSCEDGEWGEWSGSFTHKDCAVVSCDDGETGTRERYEEVDGACQSETQERRCEDGKWGEWSGSFSDKVCGGQSAPQCVAEDETRVDAGDTETRQRYEAEIVAAGDTCVTEEQVRRCEDGEWGEWSGSFSYEECEAVEFMDCAEDHHHGTVLRRERYETATVPSGSTCNSETQTLPCDNGVVGEWTGTFTFEDCEVEAGSAYCAVSPGLCISAPTTTESLAAWCTVTPAEGSCQEYYFGQCAFEDDSHPEGYTEYYYNWDGPMKTETDCTQEGGSYTAAGPQ